MQSGCSLTSRDGRGNSCLHWAAASHSSSAGKALAEMFLGHRAIRVNRRWWFQKFFCFTPTWGK